MNQINFTELVDRTNKVLKEKNHKDIEIKSMFRSGQNVVVNLEYKGNVKSVVLPIERFHNNLWKEIENKIHTAAVQLGREGAKKHKKKATKPQPHII